jgi:excisionase family DNA binding protein
MREAARVKLERILTLRHISQKLLVAESTVYDWVQAGYIPHIRVGRLIRFDEGAIDRWLRQLSHPGRQRRRLEVEVQ